ncbi:MAG: sigma-70 family RNA polymerase sigma factor [Planctomycetes bacterium]|nr:sigma-70 family RNA polymerase sigma factor [Planctomycetota bacterium]MCC7169977.1 sigma-70 family RNA polymerase sigma factor [Planctomycetota bacterium]
MSKPRVDLHSPIGALLEQRAFLRRLARSLVRDAAAADDLEQDTWIAALKRPPRSSRSALAWIASTTRRIANKLRRGGERRAHREFATASPERIDGDEDAIHRLELQHTVVAALLALDEPYRTAITMRYLDDRSPSQIAEHLGIPLNTVRAHLRRGLERLRIRLDATSGGDRGAWCLALAPLATAPLASAGIASGVVAMGTKSMIGGGLVAATALLSASLWFGSEPPPATMPTETSTAHASTPIDARPDPDDVAGGADEAPGTVQREVAVADSVALPDPGKVEFEVVDARTGAPILDAGVRMLNGSRFAEWTGSGAGELVMTAGVYDVTAFARGYETFTRPGVVVDAHGAANLGKLALERGSGTIHGTAHVAGIATPGPITIQLYGRGRRWCSGCDRGVVRTPHALSSAMDDTLNDASAELVESFDETPCTVCGYREDHSEITIEPGQRFAFHDLAQGTYLVLARNHDHSPFPTQKIVTLERGRDVWIDFALAVGVDVEFALTGLDGAPYDGSATFATDEGTRIVRSPIYFTFDEDREGGFEAIWQPGLEVSPSWSQGTARSITALGSASIAVGGDLLRAAAISSGRGSPQFDLAEIVLDRAMSAVTDGSPIWLRVGERNEPHQVHFVTPDRSDRAREPDDEPAPTALDHEPEPTSLRATAIETGRFSIRGVPPRFLNLIVRSGAFASEPAVVDTRAGTPGIVAIALRRVVCDTAAASSGSRIMVASNAGANRSVAVTIGTGPRPLWSPRTTSCIDCHERR